MTEISPELRAFAEVPQRWLEQPLGLDFRDDGRRFLIVGATWVSIVALDVAEDELGAVVEEARAVAPPESTVMWWLGPSTRPPDARERLLALGLREPVPARLDALIAVDAPPAGPEGVVVQRVETLEDYRAVAEIRWEAFALPPERRRVEEENLPDRFATDMSNCEVFLAYVDGRPAGTGTAIRGSRGMFLIGGATAEWARGRGAYRALVRARWDAAADRGTPALVTHADPATSGPILRRLGFRLVCELWRLEDPGRPREDR